MTLTIRDLEESDAERLAQLNNAATPAVPLTGADGVIELLDISDYAFGSRRRRRRAHRIRRRDESRQCLRE